MFVPCVCFQRVLTFDSVINVKKWNLMKSNCQFSVCFDLHCYCCYYTYNNYYYSFVDCDDDHGELCLFRCVASPLVFCLSHHFVYLEKWNRKKKNQNKFRVNAKYAIVPFYTNGYDLLLVLNGMKSVILKCFCRCSGSKIFLDDVVVTGWNLTSSMFSCLNMGFNHRNVTKMSAQSLQTTMESW